MLLDSVTPVLSQAALHVREKELAVAKEVFIQYANRFPDKSELVLVCAQIAAGGGHFQISTEAQSKVSDIQNMPATLAKLVSFQALMGFWKNAI